MGRAVGYILRSALGVATEPIATGGFSSVTRRGRSRPHGWPPPLGSGVSLIGTAHVARDLFRALRMALASESRSVRYAM